MRILHTSDWHLGHQLRGYARDYEHDAFLSWLTQTLIDHEVDLLLIAGDIFDSANPPPSALTRWYRFLAEVTRTCPGLQVLAIGGNHDSAARLDAPNPLLDAMNVSVVGGMRRNSDRSPDWNAMTIPLKNRAGGIQAWCAAMPFLRASDLPIPEQEQDDRLISGVRRLYQDLIDYTCNKAESHQAVLATGHCYMAGTEISQLSERKILGGNLHALPVNIFSDRLAYVALGHLHKAQAVGKREWVRYSGAPIPLSMNERLYQHEVRLVILKDGKLVSAEQLSIPRFVRMKRLKRGPLDEILAQIAELDDLEDTPDAQRPYLDIPIVLEKPLPDLRRTIEAAMKNKNHRLVNIEPQYTGHGRALGDGRKRLNLKEMKVEEVFVSCYQRHHEGEPSPELMALFNDLAGSAEEL